MGLSIVQTWLRANAAKGGDKKTHCDCMIREAIELIDEM